MKEYYPDLYKQVKEWVARGRWHPAGSQWDATDVNLPSPEAVFRNILLGQEFYRQEFGVQSNDIFLPDCFGFGYTLPTVEAHAGLIGFSTQKLQWRTNPFYGDKKQPFPIGLWQGIDGSRILAALDCEDYNTGNRFDNVDLTRDADILNLAKKGVNHTAYRYYGTGDRGGSASVPTVASVEKSLQGDGPVKIISATSGQLYQDYYPFTNHPELPVFDGELLMDVHGTGCYSSQAAMKRFNRRNEQLADGAERASVMADWLGAEPYPAKELRTEWRRFIWHQFHDDLTGTCIPKAYTFSWNDELIAQTKFDNLMTAASGGVARALNTKVKGTPLVVYNPVAADRQGIVEVDLPNTFMGRDDLFHFQAYSPEGKQVPMQIVSDKQDSTARLIFSAGVGPVGYAVYDLRFNKAVLNAGAKAPLQITDRSIENAIYKVTLNDDGDIASIVDKRSGRQLVQSGKAFRLAVLTPDVSTAWPAWEVLKKTIDETSVPITDGVHIDIAERGPVRATLKVTRRYGESRLTQYISLTNGGADDRIDIRGDLDWKTENALLKAEFPMSVSNPKAAYDLGMGYIERGNNTKTAYEVYAHEWADLTDTDGSYGIAILNNCKYGWDKPDDHTLRLTLLHNPQPDRNYTYQRRQDFGRHYFTYSIVGHTGDLNSARVDQKAELLNQPMATYTATRHVGKLGRRFSFLSLSTPQLAVKAIKQAESGDGYVVRLQESTGQALKDAEVTFAAPIEEAYVSNAMEKRLSKATFEGNKLRVSCGRFAPSTFVVKLQQPAQVSLAAPQSTMVADLPYNDYAYTVDAFNRQGNVDGRGNSYAAELVPDTITSEGVLFTPLADPSRKNAVQCDGQHIALPAGTYNYVYLLAAATDKDRTADFTVEGQAQACLVPYYSGFFGQWGHDGNTGYVKQANPAYVGTHRHSMRYGNEAYVFTYMFKLGIPVKAGAKELVLPKDKNIIVFAVTCANDANDGIAPASEMRALP
jgi:alpha-mannosidase